jgi:porin
MKKRSKKLLPIRTGGRMRGRGSLPRAQGIKVFLLLFLQKKKPLLPLALLALHPWAEAHAQPIDKTVGTDPALTAVTEALSSTVASLPPTQAIDAPPAVHLFGDWDGLQPRLLNDGINIQLDALTEFAGNVSGGTRQGSTFASQIALQNDINWERLAGMTGLSTHVVLVNRSGSSDSHLFGDNLSPVQEVYGSGGDAAVHLVSAYLQETLVNRQFDIAAGRMNVENDFASSPLYCNYMNNGLCGDPKALPGGDIGHSAYPDAVWAARVRVSVVPAISVTFGLYEVNQGLYTDQYYRSGFKFDGAKDSGIYLPAEFAWTPDFGPEKMPGHYKVGAGYDTSSGYQDFGNTLAAASVPGFTARSRRGNTQFWALADQMLLRQGPGKASGIIALLGFVHNDPNNSAYAEQYFAGLLDRGFWQTRPADTIALLFINETISGRLGNVQGVQQALDLPYSNGATGIQTHEEILEANYNIHVYRSVSLQPDLQYVIHPNAQPDIGNALVLGFRAHVGF